MKYSKQEILSAVRCVLEQEHSIKSTAKAIGMSTSTLSNYVSRVEAHGYSCLTKPSKCSYDGTFKLHVVEYIREHDHSSYSAAAYFNLTRATIQRWERIYLEEGAQALFEERRGRKPLGNKKRGRPPKLEKQVEDDLLAENQRLRMENDFLKKLNALVRDRENREGRK